MLAVGEHLLEHLEPQTRRIATAFAGGLGDSREEVCGAVSGGAMVIGALFGRVTPDEDDRRAMAVAAEFRRRFLRALGHTQCSAVREHVVNAPGYPGSCGELVEKAAEILLTVLAEEL